MSKLEPPRKTGVREKFIARRRRNGPASTSAAEGASLASPLAHEEIAARAYAHFLARNGQHGDDWGDWFRAEAELLRETDLGGILPGR